MKTCATISSRLEDTINAFDRENLQDPNQEIVEGKPVAKEWLYAQRMTTKLHQFVESPSETLQLAARCQHICRWKIPRDQYAMDKSGYKKWRLDLAQMHGDIAGNIMQNQGYEESMIVRVKDLLLKRGLKRDAEVQTLEDVICLVFIEFYLEDFAQKHNSDKLIDIIRKTWNKMSPQGQEAALALTLPDHLSAFLKNALATHS